MEMWRKGCFALGAVAFVIAGVSGEDKQDALLKARIVQLEATVHQLRAESAVCTARLMVASQEQSKGELARQRQELEKALGCEVDWAATPPACKPAK